MLRINVSFGHLFILFLCVGQGLWSGENLETSFVAINQKLDLKTTTEVVTSALLKRAVVVDDN
jgi:hypothetical protein